MSSEAALPKSPHLLWLFVVSAAFAVTFVGFGCAYTFSAFVESLQRDFGETLATLECREVPDSRFLYSRRLERIGAAEPDKGHGERGDTTNQP